MIEVVALVVLTNRGKGSPIISLLPPVAEFYPNLGLLSIPRFPISKKKGHRHPRWPFHFVVSLAG
jgi:hypothetical protein